MAPDQRLPDDEALGPGNAGERAELRVAAFDQLAEQRTVETGADSVGSGSKLARMAVERLPLGVVAGGHVDHERWRRGIVDEVVTNPLGTPRFPGGAIPAQATVEDGFGQHS